MSAARPTASETSNDVSDTTATDIEALPPSGGAAMRPRLAGLIGLAVLAAGSLGVILLMSALVAYVSEWMFWSVTLVSLVLVNWIARNVEEMVAARAASDPDSRQVEIAPYALPAGEVERGQIAGRSFN